MKNPVRVFNRAPGLALARTLAVAALALTPASAARAQSTRRPRRNSTSRKSRKGCGSRFPIRARMSAGFWPRTASSSWTRGSTRPRRRPRSRRSRRPRAANRSATSSSRTRTATMRRGSGLRGRGRQNHLPRECGGRHRLPAAGQRRSGPEGAGRRRPRDLGPARVLRGRAARGGVLPRAGHTNGDLIVYCRRKGPLFGRPRGERTAAVPSVARTRIRPVGSRS